MVAILATDGITQNRHVGAKDHIRERREPSPGFDFTPLPPKSNRRAWVKISGDGVQGKQSESSLKVVQQQRPYNAAASGV